MIMTVSTLGQYVGAAVKLAIRVSLEPRLPFPFWGVLFPFLGGAPQKGKRGWV